MTEVKSSNTRVAKSSIPNAGRGVFANKSFSPGDELCFYDGYEKDPAQLTKIESEYHVVVQDKSLIGYIVPKSSTAQIINDAGSLNLSKLPTGSFKDQVKFIINQMVAYALTANKCNCGHADKIVDEKLPFYAIRPIAKDEELFFHYGAQHWLNKWWLKSSTEVKRAIAAANMCYCMGIYSIGQFAYKMKRQLKHDWYALHLLAWIEGFIIFDCYGILENTDISIFPTLDDIEKLERMPEGKPKKIEKLDDAREAYLMKAWNMYLDMYLK